MKSVLISIQPKWCDLIAIGQKTIEVRKNKPKLATPFKVYIYETRAKCDRPIMLDFGVLDFHGRGQVIGEFLCDEVINIVSHQCSYPFDDDEEYYITQEALDATCLTYPEIVDYGDMNPLYGWHISNLKIYDNPKMLSEFKRVCDGNCQSCKYAIWQTSGWTYEPRIVDCKPITRPPQSWCYVEEQQQ